jgi:TatD DNase family protein
MNFVDTHTHVYDSDFAGKMLLVSTFIGKKNPLYDGDEDSAERVLEAANRHDNTYAILGIYPEFAHDLDIEKTVNELRDIIKSSPQKVKAVGEIGLDYHCNPTKTEVAAQQKLFRAQLELAKELDLPVSLHIRDACAKDNADAFLDAFRILAGFPRVRGVCHSFTGNRASLGKALELGLYVSVNGIYTFNKDAGLQSTLNSIPLNRLLLETDAPFLTPAPHRKERNKSSFIPVIAASVAKSRGTTTEEVAKTTTQNAADLFAI